ncbi:NAD(P)/FAD-dependent oxidoreductase [Kitasatospora sp. SUK 42]|uniref:flavin monoamine oxidase family protein n=1 Tax=Kitasatospora sp. SUK 42 TaxID=1588882 RepID=UPI0018CA039B|nr:NAD(P)/FAD-dependent oxidoreductase [Kitasatospora sp. SUK 42]MBV2155286.1 FAD-dependent oxidoreductase [Kitasatospora sp. SUK 42]
MNAFDLPAHGGQPLRRRAVLRAAGVTALSAAAGAATVGTARAATAGATVAGTTAGAADTLWDTVIIGAGFAGITAARELKAKGQQVLVLEARDRIGGRTWTDTFAGQQIELGGTWVAPGQPNMMRELARYKIGTVPDAAPDRAIFPSGTGYASFAPDVAFAKQNRLMTPLFDGSRDYLPDPYQPFTRVDLLNNLDGLSLRDRLDQMRMSPDDEKWVNGVTSGYSGGSSKRGALTYLARWWALSNWDFDTFNGLSVDKPVGGTVALLKAILAEGAPTLQLSSPVSTVTDNGTQVSVTTRAGAVYRGRRVIVATPANVWKNITFTKALPAEFTTASTQGIGAPNARKVWMQVRGPVGRFFAQGYEGGSQLNLVIPQAALPDGLLMVAFCVDPTLDTTSVQQVQAALRVFEPRAEVVAIRVQDWAADEFSLGGWTFQQPYQLTRLLRVLQQPQGKVVFATSDIANGWSGYMDGAVESGIRAAGLAATL